MPPLLFAHAQKLIHRDMNQQFIAMGLLGYLQIQKIIRPGYTVLQIIVSTIINKAIIPEISIACFVQAHLPS